MSQATPIESEIISPEEAAAFDAWLRAKVEESLTSSEPTIPHDKVMADLRKHIARRRSASR